MLTEQAKKDYQREYMRKYMKERRSVKTPLRPIVKTPVIPAKSFVMDAAKYVIPSLVIPVSTIASPVILPTNHFNPSPKPGHKA